MTPASVWPFKLAIAPGATVTHDAAHAIESGMALNFGDAASTFENHGRLAPAGVSAGGPVEPASIATSKPGMIRLADTGRLELDLFAPPKCDRIDAKLVAPVELGGTLAIALASGVTPAIGSKYELVRGLPVTGTFEQVEMPPAPVGGRWRLQYWGTAVTLELVCLSDCDHNEALNIDDFVCFQTLFAIGDPLTDCDGDGTLTIDDFVCFQAAYAVGC